MTAPKSTKIRRLPENNHVAIRANALRKEKYGDMTPQELDQAIAENARRQRINQMTARIVSKAKDAEHALELAKQAKKLGQTLRAWRMPDDFLQAKTLEDAIREQRAAGRHQMVLETLYKIGFEGVMPIVVTIDHPLENRPVYAVVDEPLEDVDQRIKAMKEYADRVLGRPTASDKVEEQTSTQHLNRTKQAKMTLDDITNEINNTARANNGGTAASADGDVSE